MSENPNSTVRVSSTMTYSIRNINNAPTLVQVNHAMQVFREITDYKNSLNNNFFIHPETLKFD